MSEMPAPFVSAGRPPQTDTPITGRCDRVGRSVGRSVEWRNMRERPRARALPASTTGRGDAQICRWLTLIVEVCVRDERERERGFAVVSCHFRAILGNAAPSIYLEKSGAIKPLGSHLSNSSLARASWAIGAGRAISRCGSLFPGHSHRVCVHVMCISYGARARGEDDARASERGNNFRSRTAQMRSQSSESSELIICCCAPQWGCARCA